MTGQAMCGWCGRSTGRSRRANYAYRLTSPQVAVRQYRLRRRSRRGPRAASAPWPMRVPLRLTARRDRPGSAMSPARSSPICGSKGCSASRRKFVRGDGLTLTSDKLKGKVSLLIDLVTGRFDILVSGGLTRYLIPGLGIVDVTTELHVVPRARGKGSRVIGTGKAWVRRLDNSFFRELTGGLPRLETRLERTPDGILHFSDLQLYSPKLRLSGGGIRRRDGTFHIEARGRQAQYGPLRLTLDGRIERPRLDMLLDSPNEAMGIRQMRLLLDADRGRLRLSRVGRVAARAVHQQWPDPAAQGRPDDDRDRRARCHGDDGARQPALRSGRLHRHADAGRRRAGRELAVQPGRRRPEDRGASDRQRRALRRAAGAAASRAGGSTGRSCSPRARPRSTGWWSRAGCRAGRSGCRG